jgi:hypothetical protein
MFGEEKPSGDAPRGHYRALRRPREKLSEQQKDWIRESIDRLKAPSMIRAARYGSGPIAV